MFVATTDSVITDEVDGSAFWPSLVAGSSIDVEVRG